jgi:hypothetical protein
LRDRRRFAEGLQQRAQAFFAKVGKAELPVAALSERMCSRPDVLALPSRGGNRDGMLSSLDAIYPSLRLWRDSSHDGISNAKELFTLPALGITAISLQFSFSTAVDQHGNALRYLAPVLRNNQWNSSAADVFPVYQRE